MGMPNMSRWSKEAKDKAMAALKERDNLFVWDKEDNDLAIIGKNGYDECYGADINSE